ncbi:hypothetical protein A0256_13695 [Mucilaginibacter sp. PAMC 26640]|nr:hypothetical protein A0256_13695 [Mucilaginibacter sp. PAMC 26640]
MNGVTLFETPAILELIEKITQMSAHVEAMHLELIDLKKPYMTVKEVSVYTGFSTAWVNAHKHDIGCSVVGGSLRFKRKDVEWIMQDEYFKKPRKKVYLPPGY